MGGKPNHGTKPDKRLADNKAKATAKPAKGFKPFTKKGK